MIPMEWEDSNYHPLLPRRRRRQHGGESPSERNTFVKSLVSSKPTISKMVPVTMLSEFSGKFGSVQINRFSTPDRNSLRMISPMTMNTKLPIPSDRPSISTMSNNGNRRFSLGRNKVPTPLRPQESEKEKNILAHKQQIILNPNDRRDVSYHEVIIHKAISSLKGKCPGFTYLLDWYKSNSDDGKLSMNMIMETGGVSLKEFSIRNDPMQWEDFRNIAFQLLFTLYIAQRECEFVHNDLHVKNVLVDAKGIENDARPVMHEFRIHDLTFQIPPSTSFPGNILVKLTDFGHARVTVLDEQTLQPQIFYNKNKEIVFDASQDVLDLRRVLRSLSSPSKSSKKKGSKKGLMGMSIQDGLDLKELYVQMGRADRCRGKEFTPEIYWLLQLDIFKCYRTEKKGNLHSLRRFGPGNKWMSTPSDRDRSKIMIGKKNNNNVLKRKRENKMSGTTNQQGRIMIDLTLDNEFNEQRVRKRRKIKGKKKKKKSFEENRIQLRPPPEIPEYMRDDPLFTNQNPINMFEGRLTRGKRKKVVDMLKKS